MEPTHIFPLGASTDSNPENNLRIIRTAKPPGELLVYCVPAGVRGGHFFFFDLSLRLIVTEVDTLHHTAG